MPTVLITGAAGGIGQAMVHTFADAGYRVIATDRTEQPANLPCAEYQRVDLERLVTDADHAEAMINLIRETFAGQGLDALINNAAVQILGGVQDLSRENWRRSLDVNLLAPFLLTQAMLPDLEKVQGCVVNVSSIHARLTKRNFVAYATTKAALSGMSRAMAVDLGSRVRVNAVEPAAIETPMLLAGFVDKSDLYNRLEACHPRRKIGRPEEVAQMALLLASRQLPFLHGACVALDGGVGSRLFDLD